MSIKKVFSLLSLIFVFSIASVNISAQTAQNSAPVPVKYTDAQKACIQTAQAKMTAAVKNAADTLKNATFDALKVKEAAITDASKIKNAKNKAASIKAATEAYSNDPTVKQARIPYMAAIKDASEIYKADQKLCLNGAGNSYKGFFRRMGDGFWNFGSNMMRFFSGKK